MGIYLLGSRHLRVGLDSSSRVQEVHYPHVGNSHTLGSLYHRIGIFVDGRISWIDGDDGWHITRKTTQNALIPHTVAVNRSMGVTLEFIDAVDDDNSTFLRNIHIVNMHSEHREIKIFMHQGFIFNGNSFDSSTGSYSDEHKAIVHHGPGVAFAVSLSQVSGGDFDQHAIGLFGTNDLQGTYVDAMDGHLHSSNHQVGSVDSTMGLTLQVSPMGSIRASYVLAASTKPNLALDSISIAKQSDMAAKVQRVAASWRKWLKPALRVIDRIEEPLQSSFITSLMSIRAHIDTTGAVMTHRPDGGTIYSSPRIAGYAIWPLIRLGYKKEAESYFEFMREALAGDVEACSLYTAEGATGPNRHPHLSMVDGRRVSPVASDDAAMLVFMFAQLYGMNPSKALLEGYYESFIVPLLERLSESIDRVSGLPAESYSILSQDEPVQSTFSISLTYAALLAGSDLAELKRDAGRAVGWRSAADEMYRGAGQELIDENTSQILKFVGDDSSLAKEFGIDDLMAAYGVFMYGLAAPQDTSLTNAYESFKSGYQIGVNGQYAVPVRGDANYGSGDVDFPVAALWCAQYAIELNREDEALDILRWVRDAYYEPQPTPITRETRSISELASLWTRAEYVSTVLDLITDPREVK